MGLLAEPLQVSLVIGVNGGIRPNARNVAFMSEQIPGGAEGPNNWQVIGISRDQWKLIGASLVLGGNVRAGLEDNLYLPNGEMARSNGDLIAKARQMAEDVGRRAATVAEARELLDIPGGRARAGATGHVSELPLSDVRVLDLTRLLPGGFCSLLLADFGADVVKVEDTGMGDYVRWAPPYYGDDEHQTLGTRSALYLALNRGKRSIRHRPEVRRRPRGLPAAGARLRRRARELPPGRARPARVRLRGAARGQPADRLLRDHRLRPDRPEHRARRPRHELPRPQRAARADRRPPTARRSRRPARSPTSAAAR